MAILKFEEVYFLSMICLKINRCHPEVPLDLKWARVVGLCYSVFTVAAISILYSLFVVDIKEDFTKSCTDGIFLVMWTVVTVQGAVLLLFREPLKKLIQMTQESFDLADSLPTEDQAIIIKYAHNGRWVSRLWLCCYSLNGTLFAVKALILSLYSLYVGQFQLVPIYDHTFPSPIDQVKYRLDVYSVIFICQVFFGAYAVASYVGFCPLGPIFILNSCAQLELMAKEIATVFNETPYNHEHASRKIAGIIQNLQRIYRYVKLINNMFDVMHEFTLKASVVMMPIIFYQVIDNFKRGEMRYEYIAFIFSTTMICYVPCYYSDLLMEKGEEFRLAIYRSGWECIYDRNARKSLLLMLTIAIRPISIQTIFRTLCLDAFAKVGRDDGHVITPQVNKCEESSTCHQAYALFNLLCAAWD